MRARFAPLFAKVPCTSRSNYGAACTCFSLPHEDCMRAELSRGMSGRIAQEHVKIGKGSPWT